MVKTFAISRLYLHSHNDVHDYQLLLPFIVHCIHMQKFVKNLHGCKVIHKKCESFSLRMISNVQYSLDRIPFNSAILLSDCFIKKYLVKSIGTCSHIATS